MFNLESFVEAYTITMQWSSTGTDQEGNDLDSLEGFDVSAQATLKIKEDCQAFISAGAELLAKLPEGYTYADAGHDFWLTRNGHGVGFWDRGLGELGESLTELAKAYGELSPYVGDDGKIYF